MIFRQRITDYFVRLAELDGRGIQGPSCGDSRIVLEEPCIR